MNLLIPWPYRILAIMVLLLSAIGFGWTKGAGHVQDQWDSATAKQSLVVHKTKQRQAEATVKVVTQYVDRVKVVREKAAAIVHEVPVYVPSDSCSLPGGFRVLHDAAASGGAADSARIADAAPVAAQAVAATVVDNYATCHEVAQQLKALQEWVLFMGQSPGNEWTNQ